MSQQIRFPTLGSPPELQLITFRSIIFASVIIVHPSDCVLDLYLNLDLYLTYI